MNQIHVIIQYYTSQKNAFTPLAMAIRTSGYNDSIQNQTDL